MMSPNAALLKQFLKLTEKLHEHDEELFFRNHLRTQALGPITPSSWEFSVSKGFPLHNHQSQEINVAALQQRPSDPWAPSQFQQLSQ